MGGAGSGRKPKGKKVSELSRFEGMDAGSGVALLDPADMPRELRGVPEDVVEMLMLRAQGLSYAAVGKKVGMTRDGVRKACVSYDPKGLFYLSPDIRDKMREARLESLAAELGHGLSSEDLDGLTTMQRVTALGIISDKLRDLKRLGIDKSAKTVVESTGSLAGLIDITDNVDSGEAQGPPKGAQVPPNGTGEGTLGEDS